MKYAGILSFFLLLFGCSDRDVPYENSQDDTITNIVVRNSDSEYLAFCDMVEYEGKYYIAFRVGENHVPDKDYYRNGYIKIVSSDDLKVWTDEIDVVDENWDLRDPNFCLNTDTNQLSLNYGLYSYSDKYPKIKNKRVVFSKDSDKLQIEEINHINVGEYSYFWLWKIYYYNRRYYSIAYRSTEYPILVTSVDGYNFNYVNQIPVPANETALTFEEDNIIAISRNIDSQGNAFLLQSRSPYKEWNVQELNEKVKSPEIVKTESAILIAGRSEYGVSIFSYDRYNKKLDKWLNLFAKGRSSDYGYPGMIYSKGRLHIVYYACNDMDSFPSICMTSIRLR